MTTILAQSTFFPVTVVISSCSINKSVGGWVVGWRDARLEFTARPVHLIYCCPPGSLRVLCVSVVFFDP